jgi:hypothetical protein
MAAAVQPTQPAVQTKFAGSGSMSSPFGAAARSRSLTEPKGLSPDMGPDPIVKPAPLQGNFLSRITITQVVRVWGCTMDNPLHSCHSRPLWLLCSLHVWLSFAVTVCQLTATVENGCTQKKN